MTEKEALKLALEAMNLARAAHGQMLLSDPPQEAWKAWGVAAALTKAMTAVNEALAEQPAQQQPVGKVNELFDEAVIEQCGFDRELLVYTSPQPSKPWVGLTQQDIDIAFDDTQEGGGFNEFARAIEAKLREKNT